MQLTVRIAVAAALLGPFLLVVPAGVQDRGEWPTRSKPLYRNVESRLSQLVERAVRGGVQEAKALAARAPLSRGSRVAVSIRVAGKANDIVPRLSSRGAVVANIGEDVVEAYVELLDVPNVSDELGVLRIETIKPPVARDWARPATSRVGRGSVISQGVTVHNADAYQAAGFTGEGVKVGVIDDEFGQLRQLMGSELPATIRGFCYSLFDIDVTSDLANCEGLFGLFPEFFVHGAAASEALVDVAPGVTLYVANPYSPLSLLAAERWMKAQGVRVINDSLAWTWNGPGDGTSPYSDAPVRTIDRAVEDGILWVNAAGDSARATWSGPYLDSDGDKRLEFRAGEERNLLANTLVPDIQMRWQDTWRRAATDLDLFVEDDNGKIVASSTDYQTGARGEDPFESLWFSDRSDRRYYVVITHHGGPIPEWIEIQALDGADLDIHTAGGIANPAESKNPGMLAVGAAPWRRTDTIEPFSSLGPTRDGRTKPDIVGADHATSASYEGPWRGTALASAHVAGLAALLLHQDSSLTPKGLADKLKRWALRRGVRPNNTWGHGFAILKDP